MSMIKKQPKRTFHFGTKDKGVTIFVKESFTKDFLCHVWPSAILMSEFIWDNPGIFNKKKILELGSGCGLPSLLLSKLDTEHVILSDTTKNEKNLSFLTKNIDLNGDDTKKKSSVVGLTWGRFTKQNIKLSPNIIIGSDIFYDENEFQNILCSLQYYFNNGCETCYTVLQHRGTHKLLALLLFKWKMKVEELEIDDLIYKSNFLTLEESEKLMLVKITSQGSNRHQHHRFESILGKNVASFAVNVSRSVSMSSQHSTLLEKGNTNRHVKFGSMMGDVEPINESDDEDNEESFDNDININRKDTIKVKKKDDDDDSSDLSSANSVEDK